MANAWNLFRTLQKHKIGMLEFEREVVMIFCYLLEEVGL